MVRVYRARKNLRVKIVEVNWKKKGRDFRPFKQESMHYFVYNEATNELFTYNKFTGANIKNYMTDGSPKAYKPLPKEKKQLFKQFEEIEPMSVHFLSKKENDFNKDFPEVFDRAREAYNKRFN